MAGRSSCSNSVRREPGSLRNGRRFSAKSNVSMHGDEDLRRTDLTGTAIDDPHCRPGVVDEPDGQDAQLLGGRG